MFTLSSLHLVIVFSTFSSFLAFICMVSSAHHLGSCFWNLRVSRSSWFDILVEWILCFFELLTCFLSFCSNLWRCILVHLFIQLLCSLSFLLSLLNKKLLFLQTFYCCVVTISLLFEETTLDEKTNILIEGVDLFHLLVIVCHVLLHLF